MRAGLPIVVPLVAALLVSPALRTSAASADPAAPPPVVACASLANLRTVLRDAKGEAAAAIPVITDPKSDLGCTVLDRKAVTGIADQVSLNGHAYECLSLQGTSICQWTVAGSARPVAPDREPARTPPAAAPAAKGRH